MNSHVPGGGEVVGPMVGQPFTAGPPMPAALRQSAANINNNIGEGGVQVKQESNLMEGVCAQCGRTISDRYVMRVNERDYHEACLACCECSAPLSHSCYTRDCKLYCRLDYERVFGAKCGRCQQKLDCNDLVQRVPAIVSPLQQQQQTNNNPEPPSSGGGACKPGVGGGAVFHVDCFVCCICGEPLLRGAPYILRHGQPLCKREFPSDIYSLNSPQDDDLMDDSRPRDGRRGPKRPRTILTSVQRRQFKASFEVSPKPCRKVREALAKDTGLSVRVVQVWFQNQRAKVKKMQRKAKTEASSDKEPKEERNKTESPHSDHSHYLNALSMRDGESSSFPSSTQPLNPNNPYSPDDVYPGHSGDSFCSSDVSLDGTEPGFEMCENESGGGPDGSHQSGGGGGHSHHGQASGPGGGQIGIGGGHQGSGGHAGEMPSLAQSLHSTMHNPIDKLFMMQNSYFSSADHS
ncbi:LIM homeobox transcription factor 1-beta-like [Trichogramma pretiosum]|uniref:LIM homeobox transcription factor 1-beta-like n=1 Tax=Trichogramma pretiosum TaxID=7493 RepID=UPI000C71C1FB|nr:LIM homeobox transcription factor 1-beta-like [Trichogramma pretiosum]